MFYSGIFFCLLHSCHACWFTSWASLAQTERGGGTDYEGGMSEAGNWDAEEKERYLLTNMFTIALSPPSHYAYRLCLLPPPQEIGSIILCITCYGH